MTDAELSGFLGLSEYEPEVAQRVINALPTEKRAVFERMAQVEHELKLWQLGLGPKPSGAIVCRDKTQ